MEKNFIEARTKNLDQNKKEPEFTLERINDIDKKNKDGVLLTKEDIIFIYKNVDDYYRGIPASWEEDVYSRIMNIRENRNLKEDVLTFFDCSPERVAWNEDEINENTLVYIGPLFPDIFSKKIDNIYTSFPEGRVDKYEINTGDKDANQIMQELDNKGIRFDSFARGMMKSSDFKKNLKDHPEIAQLVSLTKYDLGLDNRATYESIFYKIKKFGLEFCSPEIGPELRLQYSGNQKLAIAMEQIYMNGYPSVFLLDRSFHGDPELKSEWVRNYVPRDTNRRFVFRLSKQT